MAFGGDQEFLSLPCFVTTAHGCHVHGSQPHIFGYEPLLMAFSILDTFSDEGQHLEVAPVLERIMHVPSTTPILS